MASAVLAFGTTIGLQTRPQLERWVHCWKLWSTTFSRQLPTCLWWAFAGIISVTTDLNHLHSSQFIVLFGIERRISWCCQWRLAQKLRDRRNSAPALHLYVHQSMFTKTLQEKNRLILLLIPDFDFRYLLLTSLREVIAIGVAERPPMLWNCLRQG